jgi:hypothetical protein
MAGVKDDGLADAQSAKARLTTTIVALAAIGETDLTKLKTFALHAARATFRRRKRVSTGRQGAQIAAQTF